VATCYKIQCSTTPFVAIASNFGDNPKPWLPNCEKGRRSRALRPNLSPKKPTTVRKSPSGKVTNGPGPNQEILFAKCLIAAEDASPVVKKKQKPAAAAVVQKPATKKAKKPAVEAKKKEPKLLPMRDPEDDASDEEEADGETQALARALDSESDNDGQGEGTFVEGQDVGKIPDVVAVVNKPSGKEEPGVIYLGGIPHGFYEHELRGYFSQFGPIRRLRLSRSPRTGRSRHYAFIEFEDESTAEIVAKTMSEYLLFGNILRCKVVPKSQQHENLFKGANRRFKKVPWAKLEARKLERPKSQSEWTRKIGRETERRASRAEKLQAMGYEFDAPALKAVEEIPQRAAAIGNGDGEADGQVKATEPGPEEATTAAITQGDKDETSKPKAAKGKKAPKTKKAKS